MSQPFDIVTDPDVVARRKERAVEYGTWECGEAPIEVGGARAFNEGDPVPKSTVERLGLDALGAVVKSGTFLKKTAELEAARQKANDAALREHLAAASPVQPKPASKQRARRGSAGTETAGTETAGDAEAVPADDTTVTAGTTTEGGNG